MWIEAKIAVTCLVYVAVVIFVFGAGGYLDEGDKRKLSEGPFLIRALSVTGLMALLLLPACFLAMIWFRA